MQQDVIFHGVQADDKIRLQSTVSLELLLKATNLAIVLINHFDATAAQNLRAVGDGPGDPAIKQVAASSHLCSLHNSAILAISGADKQHETSALRHSLYDCASAAKMRGRHVEGDNVDTLADTEDVAGIDGIPERSRVTEM